MVSPFHERQHLFEGLVDKMIDARVCSPQFNKNSIVSDSGSN